MKNFLNNFPKGTPDSGYGIKTGKLLVIVGILLLTNNILSYGAPDKNNSKKPTNASSPDPSNKIRILSDEAKYDRKNKTALATGHVKIIQDNVTIFTASALYNQEIHTSFIDQFVRIIHLDKETKRKTDISANKMIVYHQEKKVHLEDDVRFDREEERKIQLTVINPTSTDRDKTEQAIRRERTVVTAKIADYWTKSGDAIFTGDVVVLQKEKKALGDTVTIKNDANKNTDTITLDKNAKLIQIKGEWLAREGIIDPKEDKEKERLIKERLEMNADKIIIFQKTSNAVGNGNVKIIQNVADKRREATGEHAVFDDINKTMTLTGNVKIKRENEDWLTAEKAVFHSDSENFEAFSTIDNSTTPGNNKQVQSEFLIPDEEKPASEPPIGTSEPDFNLDEKKSPKPTVQPKIPTIVTPVPNKTPLIKPSSSTGNVSKPTPKPDINPYRTPVPISTISPVPFITPKPQGNNQTPNPQKTNSKPNSSGEFNIPIDNN